MALMSFGAGFVVGFGTGFVSREALPIAQDILAPISRLLMKGSILAVEKSREAFSYLGEAVEDMTAEIRHELRKGKEKQRKKKMKTKTRTASSAALERTA